MVVFNSFETFVLCLKFKNLVFIIIQTGITLPLSEDVVRHTNHVTKCIQELWTNIRSSEACKAFVPGATKIRTAVVELTAIFPHVSNYCFPIY